MTLQRLYQRISRFATLIGMVRDHLLLVRIPLLLVAAAAVLTLRVDQIDELFFLLGQSGERPLLQAAGALLTSFLLGIAVWYTARVLFRFRFRPRPFLAAARMSGLRVWLPRVLGAGVPGLMAIACLGQLHSLRGGADADEIARLVTYAACFAVEAVLIFLAVVFRRRIARSVARRMQVKQVAHASAASSMQRVLDDVPAHPEQDARLRKFRDLEPLGRRFLLGGASFNLVLLLAAWWAPESIAWIGVLGVIQLTALCFVLTGGLVLIFTEPHAIPVISLIALAAIALQALEINDNHHVRQTASMASYQTAHVTVQEGPDAYAALGRRLTAVADDAPVFLISAEGGGIRAAAWTALVLARLENASSGRFDPHVIAASGVSGGSLGLATYIAMQDLQHRGALDVADFACKPAQSPASTESDRCPARAFLTHDFLKPAITNMLIVDQAQRWFPVAFLPDRGSKLEHAWERSWHGIAAKKSDAPNAFEESWRALSGVDAANQPWLLLNSTIVDSGQRFIQQPYQLDADLFDRYFPGATDGARWLGPDTPLSAVVHNSARFTYISPAGTLDPPANHPELGPAIQLVDGGYFENSGTATLAGVFRLLTEAPPTATANLPVNPDRLYVIHISNDPNVPSLLDDGSDRCGAATTAADKTETSAAHYGEIAAPVFALLNTREGRGEVSRRALARLLPRGHFFHFRLCEGVHHLPLGWTLSSAAWNELDRQLGGPDAHANEAQIASNAHQLERLINLLSNLRESSQPAVRN